MSELAENTKMVRVVSCWDDLIAKTVLHVIGVLRGHLLPHERAWVTHSVKSSSRYILVRVGAPPTNRTNSFIIRVSDHELPVNAPGYGKHDFEIVLRSPYEPGESLNDGDVEYYMNTGQVRAAVRAAKRAFVRWAKDARPSKDPPPPPAWACYRKR